MYVYVKGLYVDVNEGRFESAMRLFNKKVQNSGILKEVKDRRYYSKPSEEKKLQQKSAKKRLLKRLKMEKPVPQANIKTTSRHSKSE